MSIIHYLSANKVLPIGEFNSSGKNLKLNSEVFTYKSRDEAAGIYVQKLTTPSVDILSHFKNSNIYTIAPNIGKFFFCPELKVQNEETYYENRKCILELINYICENICDGEEFEIYSCWSGEEELIQEEKLHEVIDLKHFSLGDEFSLDDKKYILIKG